MPATLLVTDEDIEVARDKKEATFEGPEGSGWFLTGDVGAEMVLLFDPNVSVRGGSVRLLADGLGRPGGPLPGVAEVGRPATPSGPWGSSSFSLFRSPCEKRRFKRLAVEVNF